MITIFTKDLRENLKWAVLILIGTALACAVTTKDYGSMTYWLLGMQPATTACAAIGGLGLGVLQFIFEARRDHYAFLVHRPVSRTRFFIAKALAGLLLLTVAVAVPYLLSVAWVAAPSHRSFPFRWQMMLPALVDTLCGFIYYFAGVLIAMREARWYASRVLAIGGMAILDDLLVDYRQDRTYTQYEFSLSGDVLRIVSEPGSLPSVTDLDGRKLPEYTQDAQDWHRLRARCVAMGWLDWSRYETPMFFSVEGYRSPYHWIRPLRGAISGEEWFFDIARQQIIGYDTIHRSPIGTMTPSGFHPPDARLTDCFPGTPQMIAERYLTFSEAVYDIDTAARKVSLSWPACTAVLP